jgi:probable phosphomutase (TIGR03848 family)
VNQFIVLVRHAEAAVRPGRLAGWTPGLHLSEHGRGQAGRLAERLRPVRLAAVYSSPLERCVETAQAVAEGRGLDVSLEEGIGEVRFGSWQGRPYKVLAKTDLWRQVQVAPSNARFPGGESVRELQARAVDAVEAIRARHRRGAVAVVSHADTIKAIVAHYLGMHLDLFQRIVIAPASVTVFVFGGSVGRLLRLSDTGDFEEIAAATRPKGRSKVASGGLQESVPGGKAGRRAR